MSKKLAIVIRAYGKKIQGYMDPKEKYLEAIRYSLKPEELTIESVVESLNARSGINTYTLEKVDKDIEFID